MFGKQRKAQACGKRQYSINRTVPQMSNLAEWRQFTDDNHSFFLLSGPFHNLSWDLQDPSWYGLSFFLQLDLYYFPMLTTDYHTSPFSFGGGRGSWQGRRTFLAGAKLLPAPGPPYMLFPLPGSLSSMCHLANFFSIFVLSSITFESPSWILPSPTSYLLPPPSLFSCSCAPRGVTTHSRAWWPLVSPTRLWAPQGPGHLCPARTQQHPGPAPGTRVSTSRFAPLLPVTSASPLHAFSPKYLSKFKCLPLISVSGTERKKKKP